MSLQKNIGNVCRSVEDKMVVLRNMYCFHAPQFSPLLLSLFGKPPTSIPTHVVLVKLTIISSLGKSIYCQDEAFYMASW